MLQDRGPFRRKALKGYIKRMSKPDQTHLFDTHVEHILREQGFSVEEDPRSVYEPQQLYNVLERYGTNWSKYEHGDRFITYGYRRAKAIFGKPQHTQPLNPGESIWFLQHAIKMTKSAGLPSMKSKQDDFVYALDREKQDRAGVKAPNPCVAYKRTQQNNKTRLVWGYPLEMTLMESRFARPLINHFLDANTPMAFGKGKATIGANIYQEVVDREGTIVSLDYSKFDSTVPAFLIRMAFRILGTWFKADDRDRLGWDNIIRYFICTPIVMPDGHLYTGKRHGVPSGSYFTQMVDSIVNTILNFAATKKLGLGLRKRSLFVLGDDALLNVTGQVDMNAWADYLSRFGMIVNVKKTILGRAHFIGAFWDNGLPEAELQSLIDKAVQPETRRIYDPNVDAADQARDVLLSYAGEYLQGWRLVYEKTRVIGRSFNELRDVRKWISGRERFQEEEVQLSEETQDTTVRVTSPIGVRLLT